MGCLLPLLVLKTNTSFDGTTVEATVVFVVVLVEVVIILVVEVVAVVAVLVVVGVVVAMPSQS